MRTTTTEPGGAPEVHENGKPAPLVASRRLVIGGAAAARLAAELDLRREDVATARELAERLRVTTERLRGQQQELSFSAASSPSRSAENDSERGSAPRPGAAAARGLEDRHITGQPAESLANRDALLTEWRLSLVRRHARIALAAHKRRNWTLAAWHDQRASKLARPFAARLSKCGDAGTVHVTCRGCGLTHARAVGCRLRAWCGTCADEWGARQRKRAVKALGAAHRGALAEWNRLGRPRGHRPDVAMLTFTRRHSGSVEADAAAIRKGLPNVRRWLQHRNGGAYAYLAVWEVTNGRAGDGHVHVHVAACLGFVDVRELAAAWARIVDGGGVDMSTRGKLTRRGVRVSTPESAARYVAKYAAKGIRADALSDENAAAWVRITHARRVVCASRGFFSTVEKTPCECGSMEWCAAYSSTTVLPGPRGPPVSLQVDAAANPCHDSGRKG